MSLFSEYHEQKKINTFCPIQIITSAITLDGFLEDANSHLGNIQALTSDSKEKSAFQAFINHSQHLTIHFNMAKMPMEINAKIQKVDWDVDGVLLHLQVQFVFNSTQEHEKLTNFLNSLW